MKTALRSLPLLASASLLIAACTVQHMDGPPPAAPSAPAATPVAPAAPVTAVAPPAAAPVAATPAPAATVAAPAPVAPIAAPQAAPAADPKSIDACCAALTAVKRSGRGDEAKAKSAQAAQICPGIAKLVKDGKTSRDAGLAQIRSALSGVESPAECQ